jgi:Asp-tRNA(Asn)/Glu-tRNA(Gln) amidotransferase A subunit family amidase
VRAGACAVYRSHQQVNAQLARFDERLKCVITLTEALALDQMNAIFTSVDAFLAPSTSASVTMTNLTGHPAVVLKSGFVDGMPEAVMVTGRLFDEATILGIAHAYERATPWKVRHPTLR